MKARVRTQLIIDADAATVFKYLSHTKYHRLWNPPLQTVEPLIQLKEGAEYETTSVMLGVRTKSKNTVTIYKQNEEIQLENKTGMLQYYANYSLRPYGDSTRILCKISVAAKGKAFAFAKPLLEHLARRELRTDLKALKHLVEDGAVRRHDR